MKKVVRQGSRLNKHKPNNIVNESYETNHFRSAEAADALRVGEPQQSGDALMLRPSVQSGFGIRFEHKRETSGRMRNFNREAGGA